MEFGKFGNFTHKWASLRMTLILVPGGLERPADGRNSSVGAGSGVRTSLGIITSWDPQSSDAVRGVPMSGDEVSIEVGGEETSTAAVDF